MLWIKSLHIITMVTWMAGIFYLPRLFVYHAQANAQADAVGDARFKIMERKLFWGIMTPGAILTIIFGCWLWFGYGISGKMADVEARIRAFPHRLSHLVPGANTIVCGGSK